MTDACFLGVDLAWSTRARTGLAVVDESGRLLDSTTVRTDDEIAAWASGCGDVRVVAVDAPLVVPNATGQRVGEHEVQRAFGRYGAGPYPSNRSRAWFDPPRAETLAGRLGWETDPGVRPGPGRTVCIEVYPHPAMVALFGLGTVLPYKSGRGRTPQVRQGTFVRLLEHLESIAVLRLPENPRWRHVRAQVEGATRQVHLEAVEDEIDAVLCAHLAWLWQVRPDALQVYGTFADGYIVAPPPPAHEPVRVRPPRRSVPARPETAAATFDVAPLADLVQGVAAAARFVDLPDAPSVTVEVALDPRLGPRVEVLAAEVMAGLRGVLGPREVAELQARFDATVEGVRVRVVAREASPGGTPTVDA